MYNINMSMSTNIADLPGPVPEDIEEIPEEIHYQDYQDDNSLGFAHLTKK